MTPSRLGTAVLITGTDLGVGKTFVTTGLALLLKERGFSVGVMKPIELGWPEDAGPWPHDADALRDAAGVDDPPELVVPYVFEDVVAPQVLADKMAKPIEAEVIQKALDQLRSRYDVVLVEGVGGLAVPLDEGLDLAHLAKLCDMSVLIVTRAHVGTLNLTYLSVHYARSVGLKVIGAIANRLDRTLEDPSITTNAAMIQRMCDIPVLGVVPFTPEADTLKDIVDTCRSCFDVDGLMQGLGLPKR
jgi:dethiobiotin synthetase